jgi:glycosyltransferase involved in cell wall biosynthesis
MTIPLISAAICTFNRSTYLVDAIESLAQQTLDRAQYEIIIVDNNSTDGTNYVVDSAIKQHPDVSIRYVNESIQGLSAARNRATREAQGDYVAYLDDDAHADPTWLATVLDAFQKLQPTPACIGGRIYPDWDGGIPEWVPQQFLSLYSFLDHGDNVLRLNDHADRCYLNGANMAFLKNLINDDYRFSNNLGRKGTSLLSGEETEVIRKLIRDGHSVYYLPESVVWHTVLPDRQKRSYLVRRIIGDGTAQVILDMQEKRLSPRQLPYRIVYDGRGAIYWQVKAIGSWMLNRREHAFRYLLTSAQKYGRAQMELKTFLNR